MKSEAKTVAAYLASLPADRRAAIAVVRDVVRDNLDAGYEEGIQYGMIGWYVPHRLFPSGYHADPKQPLPFAALASQKNHMALYLMGVYCGCAEGKGGETAEVKWFKKQWGMTGKKLDMGKSCLRFKKLDDLALYVERYTAAMAETKGAKRKAKPAAKKAPRKAVKAAKKVSKAPKKTARKAAKK
jgi:hypothetical protein